MPTYEYLCECGEEFEEFQSISSEPVATCPVCGKSARRQISAGVGLIFKGTGFYITDYKNKGAGASGGAKSDSKSESPSVADKSTSQPSSADNAKVAASDKGAKNDKGAKKQSAA